VSEKSKSALEKAKEQSKTVWEQGKAKIHEATAPTVAPPVPPVEPASPLPPAATTE
jgi:hypothetical protein